ncbi:hypothetical protein [Cribrihabitans marinus]|uniref:hypothetical protein n=1 Tax=Cribrihabitans marinus TaxID=1227549 RepID=UPI0015A6FDD8|nr:hypothetical protein [Cribrihabitans marinus]
MDHSLFSPWIKVRPIAIAGVPMKSGIRAGAVLSCRFRRQPTEPNRIVNRFKDEIITR